MHTQHSVLAQETTNAESVRAKLVTCFQMIASLGSAQCSKQWLELRLMGMVGNWQIQVMNLNVATQKEKNAKSI